MTATISSYLRQNVLGLVAIFLALSGVTYAAGLKPNSVKSKHIKNSQVKVADLGTGSVSAAKVLDNSLTGADLQNGSVGAADLVRQQTQQVGPNPLNDTEPCPGLSGVFCGNTAASGVWDNVDSSTHERATFFKDLSGVVHLQGLVKCQPSHCTREIFYLPPGYRPANHLVLGTDSTGTKHSKIDIYADGAVRWFSANGDSATGYLSLSGLSFRASP